MQLESPEQEDRKNAVEAIFEETIAENVPILMKASSHKFEQLSEPHTEKIQSKPYVGNFIVKR